MDFSILAKAGITDQEAAKIIGVSHVSVWKYRTGRALPTRNNIRVQTLLYVLTRLVEKGSLPKVDLAFSKRMEPEIKARRETVWNKVEQLVNERVAKASTNE